METYNTQAADWMARLRYEDLLPHVMDAALQ